MSDILLPNDGVVIKEFGNGIVKLHAGQNPAGMLGYAIRNAAPKPDLGRMCATYTISTEDLDRSRDIVVTKGINLEQHRNAPIVLLGHNREAPIGKTKNESGEYTVRLASPTKLQADLFFDQHSELGQQVFDSVARGLLPGASIGFLPQPEVIIRTKGHDGYPITRYEKTHLVEVSVVPVADNPHCYLELIHKSFGGKPICKSFLDAIQPYAPERNVSVVGGYDANVVTKGCDEPYKCHSLQINLTGDAAKAVINAGKVIADEDLADNGRCSEPHVTIKYGFEKSVKVDDVARIVGMYGPLSFKLGDVGVFTNNDGFDVVYYEVKQSSQPMPVGFDVEAKGDDSLAKLHKSASELPNTDKYPEFKPHATIAYVKSGKGEHYKKLLAGEPKCGSVYATEVMFCDMSGKRTVLPLVGSKSNKKIKTKDYSSWRTKMNAMANGAMGDQQDKPDDPLLQSDEEVAPDMKVGAQFAHGLYELFMQCVDFIDEGEKHQEEPTIKRMSNIMKARLGKMASKLHGLYDEYLSKHGDMPELPPLPNTGGDEDMDEDDMDDVMNDDETTKPDDDSIPDEADDVLDDHDEPDGDEEMSGVGDDDGDEEDDEDDDDSKWTEKQLMSWNIKASKMLKNYWEYKKKYIADSEVQGVQAATLFCEKIANNPKAGEKVRHEAGMHYKNLTAALVTKGVKVPVADKPADKSPTAIVEKSADEALLMAQVDSQLPLLTKQLSDIQLVLRSITGH